MRFSCALILLSLVACGDDSTLPILDTGPEPDAFDAGGPDVFDSGPVVLEDSYLFGPCQDDTQCPGNRSFCRKPEDGYTDGQCTRECASRAQCDDGRLIHWCEQFDEDTTLTCSSRCRNTTDCGRESYVCVEISEIDPANPSGRCVGFCDEDSDCAAGTECNEQAARCVPEGTTPSAGGVTGEACAGNDDCISGDCNTAEPGGSCQSLCRIPAGFQSSNFYLTDTLPTTSCPTPGDICLPVGGLSAGSEGTCYAPCTMDGQCRTGRQCLRTIAEHQFTNGVCIPQ